MCLHLFNITFNKAENNQGLRKAIYTTTSVSLWNKSKSVVNIIMNVWVLSKQHVLPSTYSLKILINSKYYTVISKPSLMILGKDVK